MLLSFDEIHERAIAGQKKMLADLQKRGFPLVFVDEQGRLVKKHPDGRIEIIEDEEHADAAYDLRA